MKTKFYCINEGEKFNSDDEDWGFNPEKIIKADALSEYLMDWLVEDYMGTDSNDEFEHNPNEFEHNAIYESKTDKLIGYVAW